MASLERGSEIGILCEVKQGPFSGEHLISFDTVDGTVTGFVDEAALEQRNGQWYVSARVLNVTNDNIEVLVRGSFFNTNGLANIRRDAPLAA